MFNPLADKTNNLFITEHFPQAVRGQDDEITFARVDLCGRDDRLSRHVWRSFQKLMRRPSEKMSFDFILSMFLPFIECVTESTGRFQKTKNSAIVDDVVFSWVLLAQSLDF
jgi:hypothetical protein